MLLTFWQWRLSLFGAFLFSEKSFSCFQGVQPATMGAEACPKIAHSCFQLKWFALLGGCNILISGHRMSQNRAFLLSEKRFCRFGGCNILISGHRMSQNRAFLLSEKRFCRFGGMQSTILAKNGPKTRKHSCGCPFFGHSYFQLKCFALLGGCNIMCIFMTCTHA